MIVGGTAGPQSYALSLDSEVPVPECLSSIPDFPLNGYEPESAVLPSGVPLVCSAAGKLIYNGHLTCKKLQSSSLQMRIAGATNTTTLAWTGMRLQRSQSKGLSIQVGSQHCKFVLLYSEKVNLR